MLLKGKHIFAVTVAFLFLYPTIYQSIHVFEHTHDPSCCSGCSLPQTEKTGGSTPFASYDQATGEEEECPVCEFHYAKLQIIKSEDLFEYRLYSSLPAEHVYPDPHIVFNGYHFSLRAPPAFTSFC